MRVYRDCFKKCSDLPCVTVLLDSITGAVTHTVVVAGAVFDANTFALVEVVSVFALAAGMALGVASLILGTVLHTARLWTARSTFGEFLVRRAFPTYKLYKVLAR